MYLLLVVLQILGMFILLAELAYLFHCAASKLQNILIIVEIATLVNFFGYLLEMLSRNQEMALQAVKFSYLGKPFIGLGMFFFIFYFYEIKFPRLIKYLLVLFHTSIIFFVFTCEQHTLFYKNIRYVQTGVFPHLQLEHGIIYFIHAGLLAVYMVICFIAGSRRYRSLAGAQERNSIHYLNIILIISAVGFSLNGFEISNGYDFTLPAELISTILLFISMVRYNMMDVLYIAKDTMLDEYADGIAVIGHKRLVYANNQILNIFPTIRENDIEAAEMLEKLYQQNQPYEKDEHKYKISRKPIEKKGKAIGQAYVVSDITSNYNYTIQLEEQKAIAEKANRVKTDFLARVSHEIRTPINAINGMIEMILRESKENQTKKYAMDAKASSNTLLSLINDILDSSKLETGRMEIVLEEYDVSELLNDILITYGKRTREKGLTFQARVDSTIPSGLYGDDIHIRQILVHIFDTAIRNTKKGGLQFDITGSVYGDSVTLHCSVSDTSEGIKEEDIPNLFDSMKAVEEIVASKEDGMGLGITLANDLLKMMESGLSVSSVYGSGTTYSFDLKQQIILFEPVGNLEERSKNMYEEYAYESMFSAPSAKILVVDDNAINRNVFRYLLKETKVQVTDVESGFQCLDIIAKEHFDMIFLDHMMPEMDGIETLHRMKKMGNNLCKDVPVIVLTANAVVGAKEQYLRQGFDGYLSKPIVPDKLEGIIMESLPIEKLSDERQEIPQEVVEPVPVQEADTEFPRIEGFDFRYASLLIQDNTIIMQNLQSIYHSMRSDIEELERLYKDIDHPESLNNYRIKLLALKTAYASVGALDIAQLSGILEKAAKSSNIERIRDLHPVLLEEIATHREQLQFLEDNTDGVLQLDLEKVTEYLEGLIHALEEVDFDQADRLMDNLLQYQYEGDIKQRIYDLRQQEMNFETDGAIRTAREIQCYFKELAPTENESQEGGK